MIFRLDRFLYRGDTGADLLKSSTRDLFGDSRRLMLVLGDCGGGVAKFPPRVYGLLPRRSFALLRNDDDELSVPSRDWTLSREGAFVLPCRPGIDGEREVGVLEPGVTDPADDKRFDRIESCDEKPKDDVPVLLLPRGEAEAVALNGGGGNRCSSSAALSSRYSSGDIDGGATGGGVTSSSDEPPRMSSRGSLGE